MDECGGGNFALHQRPDRRATVFPHKGISWFISRSARFTQRPGQSPGLFCFLRTKPEQCSRAAAPIFQTCSEARHGEKYALLSNRRGAHDVTAPFWQGAASICKVTLADQRRAEVFDFAKAQLRE